MLFITESIILDVWLFNWLYLTSCHKGQRPIVVNQALWSLTATTDVSRRIGASLRNLSTVSAFNAVVDLINKPA